MLANKLSEWRQRGVITFFVSRNYSTNKLLVFVVFLSSFDEKRKRRIFHDFIGVFIHNGYLMSDDICCVVWNLQIPFDPRPRGFPQERAIMHRLSDCLCLPEVESRSRWSCKGLTFPVSVEAVAFLLRPDSGRSGLATMVCGRFRLDTALGLAETTCISMWPKPRPTTPVQSSSIETPVSEMNRLPHCMRCHLSDNSSPWSCGRAYPRPLRRDASVRRRVGSFGSKGVSTGGAIKASFTLSNALWCSGNHKKHFFLTRWGRSDVAAALISIEKLANWLTSPRNDRNSVRFVGVGNSLVADIFFGSAETPFRPTIKPQNSTSALPKLFFFVHGHLVPTTTEEELPNLLKMSFKCVCKQQWIVYDLSHVRDSMESSITSLTIFITCRYQTHWTMKGLKASERC